MRFTIFHEGRQGARTSNQDRVGFLHTKDCVMLVVCDGMGGHFRGEIASEFVLASLAKSFKESALPLLPDPVVFLTKGIQKAHKGLLHYAALNCLKETPRTTCIVAILQEGRAWWANVGDSRLHVVRGGVMLERTKDHSRVQQLIDAGEITPEQAAVHPERNVIYNCIGHATPRVDIRRSFQLQPGDTVLLATDGLWGPVDGELMANTLQSRPLHVSVPMLMDLAESVTGRACDNLSAVALNWFGSDGSPRDVVPENYVAETALVNDIDIEISSAMIAQASKGRPSFKPEATAVR